MVNTDLMSCEASCHTLKFQINQKSLKFKTFDFKTTKTWLSPFESKFALGKCYFPKIFSKLHTNAHHIIFGMFCFV